MMLLSTGPTDEYKTLQELVELSGIGMREVRGKGKAHARLTVIHATLLR